MEVIIGGTFDRLHKGHLNLLEAAKKLGNVTCGLTTDKFISKTKKLRKELIAPYEARKSDLEKLGIRNILPLDDEIGDSLNPKYEAIVVSKETRPAADRINELRASKGLQPLLVIEAPFALAEDGRPISSERIRQGILTREGKLCIKPPSTKNRIRRNIITLLEENELYGYELHKKYQKRFGPISLRLIYYHLSKGVSEGIFTVKAVREEAGGCSWGSKVERKYYSLAFLPLGDKH